ncbi:hypothetical protein JTB14_005474 [Gonioctena quinquepunctata]|nr:hypothetical protein JTB14_005474 [Gonioctena quinquepunctata]
MNKPLTLTLTSADHHTNSQEYLVPNFGMFAYSETAKITKIKNNEDWFLLNTFQILEEISIQENILKRICSNIHNKLCLFTSHNDNSRSMFHLWKSYWE